MSNPFGGLLLKESGYLDIITFLDAVNSWLEKDGMLINEKFDFESLNFINDDVVYKSIKATKVIFCNDVEITRSSYFTEVKFRPVKGEVLKIAITPTLNKVYNRGVFIMPSNGSHTVGSNYNYKDLSWENTKKGRTEIETKLQLLLLKEYKIVDHKAGVRPSVSDRRPVLGKSRRMNN